MAVSSGTAALHAAMHAIGIGPGDEVIVPAMTFAATANCVVYQGGTPVFADVEADTLLIDPTDVQRKITPKDQGDHRGGLRRPALRLRSACGRLPSSTGSFWSPMPATALGAEYKGRKVGSLADLTVFSFHPVKHITTGEGGMIVTDKADFAERMRRFRNHGISHRPPPARGSRHLAV